MSERLKVQPWQASHNTLNPHSPTFPGGAGYAGLSPDMGNIWISKWQAREALIQARAVHSAPPSSLPSPGKVNRGLEKLLPPVAIIAPSASTA